MKRKIALIIGLMILLALAIACKNNSTGEDGEERYESRVIVNASVQLLSGETEPLVNAELFLLNYSLLEKMRLIERDVRKEFNLGGVEQAVRQEMNYHPQKDALDKKISDALDYYNTQMNRSQTALKNLEAKEQNLLAAIKAPFRKYITAAYSNPSERNKKLRALARKRDWDGVYFLFLNESRNAESLGSGAKAAFDELQQKIDSNQKAFNQIQKQILHHRKVVKTLPDETARKLDKWRGQIEELNKKVEERTGKIRDEVIKITKQRCLEFWQATEKIPFKTDAKGEATVKVLTGKYWIAGLTEVEKKEHIWDLPFEIIRSKSKVEINSQNAIDIRNPHLYEIMVSALKGEKPEKSTE